MKKRLVSLSPAKVHHKAVHRQMKINLVKIQTRHLESSTITQKDGMQTVSSIKGASITVRSKRSRKSVASFEVASSGSDHPAP